jgi:hypothetical protein
MINGMNTCSANTYRKQAFSAAEIADGTLFKEMKRLNDDGEVALYQLEK